LGRTGSAIAPELVALYESADRSEDGMRKRIRLIHALRDVGGDEALHALTRIRQSERPGSSLKAEAYMAIQKLKRDGEALAPLPQLQSDTGPVVGTYRARVRLIVLAFSGPPGRREEASRRIHRFLESPDRERFIATVREYLEHDDPTLRSAARAVLRFCDSLVSESPGT
jgi:hypothetical protein